MTWAHVYANAANTCFANVATQPAVRDEWRVSGLGHFAPGSGPVIGPDGTVYVGTTDGWLLAFDPDGGLRWKRDTPHRGIGCVSCGGQRRVHLCHWSVFGDRPS